MTYSPMGSRAVAVRASLSTFAFALVFLFSTFVLTLPASVRADDSVSINLAIETANATLFNGPLTVTACPPVAPHGVPDPSVASTTNALCALNQSGIPVVWDWTYAPDAFLTSIGGIGNDYTNNVYWGWFSNLAYGQTALNKHTLTNGEHMLITLGKQPLQLTVSNTAPTVGDTITLTVTQFGLDASYNPAWSPATTSVVYINGQATSTDAAGNVSFVATSTDPLDVYATEDGFVPTIHTTISPVATPAVIAPTPAPTSGGGGGGIIASTPTVNISNATNYLLAQQGANGSWGSAMLSDWAAIGLISANAPTTYQTSLLNYFAQGATFSNITDYERHVMALEALGINPYTSGTIDHITSAFDGTAIGDKTQVNNDIFAIFPLLAAGYTASDPIIQKTVAFIISQQSADGSWGSVDLTAAAVQALALVPNMPGVTNALTQAKGYLLAHEDAQGCFGNSFSTSWALQAMDSLGMTAPATCLAAAQQADGSIGTAYDTQQTKIWATAYALPAALGKPWETILHTFPKPVATDSSNTGTVATATISLATLAASSTAATSTAITPPIPTTATNTATTTRTLLAPTHTESSITTTATATSTNKTGTRHHHTSDTNAPTTATEAAQPIAPNTQPAAVADAPAAGGIISTLGHFVASLWHAVAGLF